MKQPSESMKRWGGRVEGRTQVRSPTLNRTDSIRGYKSSERRAQKDFERRFFLSGLLHRRVSERAGCFRAGVFGGLAAVGNTSPQPALRRARVCVGSPPEKQLGVVWLVIESRIIVAWLHLAARTARRKKITC